MRNEGDIVILREIIALKSSRDNQAGDLMIAYLRDICYISGGAVGRRPAMVPFAIDDIRYSFDITFKLNSENEAAHLRHDDTTRKRGNGIFARNECAFIIPASRQHRRERPRERGASNDEGLDCEASRYEIY